MPPDFSSPAMLIGFFFFFSALILFIAIADASLITSFALATLLITSFRHYDFQLP